MLSEIKIARPYFSKCLFYSWSIRGDRFAVQTVGAYSVGIAAGFSAFSSGGGNGSDSFGDFGGGGFGGGGAGGSGY